MCAIVIFSIVYFVAIRHHSVELSFDQLSAFERQVHTVGNHSLYAVEMGAKDDVLASLPNDDWAKVAGRIDYVAYMYEDVVRGMASMSWVDPLVTQFETRLTKGYGIMLFECGCLIPNVVFRETRTRFQGAECMMLPGFVMAKDVVKFATVATHAKCQTREARLAAAWYSEHAWKLGEARREHSQLRKKIEAAG